MQGGVKGMRTRMSLKQRKGEKEEEEVKKGLKYRKGSSTSALGCYVMNLGVNVSSVQDPQVKECSSLSQLCIYSMYQPNVGY